MAIIMSPRCLLNTMLERSMMVSLPVVRKPNMAAQPNTGLQPNMVLQPSTSPRLNMLLLLSTSPRLNMLLRLSTAFYMSQRPKEFALWRP